MAAADFESRWQPQAAPAFDPNAEFDTVDAPPFDPSKPFEVPHLTGWQRAADIPASLGIGAVKGALGLFGGAGDLRELAGAAAKKLGADPSVGKSMLASIPYVGPLTGLAPTSADIRGAVEGVTGEFYEPKTTIGQYANTIGEFAPAAAGGLPGLGRRLLTNAAVPAVASETAGQITKGTKAEPWARAAAAIATPFAVAGARRLITPNPISAERAAAADVLRNEGVDALTAGQITGNRKIAYAESMAGTQAQQQEERALQQLSEAANRRIGETGHDVHEAVQAARPRIGAQFDRSTQRMQVHMDQQLGDDLQGVSASMLKEGLDPAQIRRVEAHLNNVHYAFNTQSTPGKWTPATNPGGAPTGFQWRDPSGGTPRTIMPGTAFHNIIKTGSPLNRMIDSQDAVLSHYGRQIRESLLDAAERTAHRQGTRPGVGARQALADFQEARQQWANMKALEVASSGAGATAASGMLTPAAVRRAATARETTDYARGRGDFNDLARASNMIMAPLPNSGTAQRTASQWPSRLIGSAVGAALGTPGGPMGHGIGATLGATLGPAIQGRAMMSRPMQRYLANQLMPPPAAAPYLPRHFRLLAPAHQQFIEHQK